MLRGVLHVHSLFSDGEASLEQLAEVFKGLGMDFALVSDHAEAFDEPALDRYVSACSSLSGPSFAMVPGLEFALHGGSLHILGYGIEKRVRASSMEQLVDGIHTLGGIAVLAHPPSGAINMITSIKQQLDGIEVWNGRYDGVHAPRAEAFRLLRRVRAGNSRTLAFGGIDLHDLQQVRKPIYLEVQTDKCERGAIMSALVAGRFAIKSGGVSIPSSGDLTFVQELSIAVRQPLCKRRAG